MQIIGLGAANIICTINPIVTTASLEPRDNRNNQDKTPRRGRTFIRNHHPITTITITSIISTRSSIRFVAIAGKV